MDINKKKTLAIFPHIDEIGYSDPISSEKLNKQFESLKESVLRALIRSQEINTTLGTFESAVNAQALALGNYYNSLNYRDVDKIYLTAFDKGISTQSNAITYDTAYGYTTLGLTSNYSKIPRNEKYNGKVSPQVTILVNGVQQEYDNASYRAVDNSTDTLWFDQFDSNSTVTFELQLPPSLTKRFNYIQIDPFPVFGFDITSVTYDDFYGNTHDLLQHRYGTHDPLSNNKGLPTKIYVSPKEFNGTVTITGKTNSTGYFGFSNIDVGFMDFNNTTQTFYYKFDKFNSTLDQTTTVQITSAILNYYFDAPNAKELLAGNEPVLKAKLIVGTTENGTLISSGDDYRLDVKGIETIDINRTFVMAPGEEIYLELQFTEHNMTTPVFRGAKLTYTTV